MRQVLRNSAVGVLRHVLACSGARGRNVLAEALAQNGLGLQESIETVATRRGDIRFYCVSEETLWRARTLLTKEPETIEWIDSFAEGDIYWDIGANVGAYALYAAASRKVSVLAFEPSAANYLVLNRNIEINGLSGNVRAYCLAFSDATRADDLHMKSTGFGGALSSFGTPVDSFGNTFDAIFKQGMIGFSIDDFIARFTPAFPNHLKIDVDGIEHLIVAGAENTLNDMRLKSVSIELDSARTDYSASLIAKIESAGLKCVAKRHGEMFDDGEYKDIFNYQFRRASSAGVNS